MRFGIFYEHQLPRPWVEEAELPAVPGSARAGGTGRPARDRLRLGGRASLPRGVLALVGARGVPGRLLAAHQADPARPRHLLMPPSYNHPARVAERIATLDLVSNGRVEWGTGQSASRRSSAASASTPRSGAPCGSRRRAGRQHAGDGPYPGFKGQFFAMPCRNIVPSRSSSRTRRSGSPARSARRSTGRAARLGALTFAFVDRARRSSGSRSITRSSVGRVCADRPRGQPECRDGGGFSCHPDAEAADGAAWTASVSSATR